MKKHITVKIARQCRFQGFLAAILITCFTGSASAADADFKYSGDTGPGFWAETPGWEACGRSTEAGARQTPINIVDAVVDEDLEKLDLRTFPTEIALINNGHTVEQEYEETGSSLYFEGTEYELLQFHFHTQSEHAVKGKRGVMELHAVFRDATKTRLAVVGMIYKIGGHNKFLQTLIDTGLPEKKGDSAHSQVEVNLSDALTNNSKYYTYAGSLTTPPCSEIVTWVVLKKKARMSRRQFQAFNNIMGNNFRPLQARNNRELRVTDD